MATLRHLGFLKLKFLTFGAVNRPILHRRTKGGAENARVENAGLELSGTGNVWNATCGITYSFFYRAMLCIRGTSHGPVSVCPSVCPSVRHKSVFY